MKELKIIRRGDYKNMAQKDSAHIGVIATINHVDISEITVKKGRTILIRPGNGKGITEWAYLIEGEIEEVGGSFTMASGDSMYVKDLRETIYCKAKVDSRVLYLSHENVVQEMTETMRKLHAMVGELDRKDHYTKSHCGRVVEWAPMMARKVGLPEERLQVLIDAALFHDLGKIEIPNEILHKPTALTPEEFEQIKAHPSMGKVIVEQHHLYEIGEVIEQHHERMDGSGYPNGLKGEEIRLEAKIIAVIDSYDAMTSDRPYRRGLSDREAKEELLKYSGIYYEPKIVDAFIEILGLDE